MRRGTTPTITFAVSNDDGTACDFEGHDIYVTLKEQGLKGKEITKREDDVTLRTADGKTYIDVTLTQEETLSFKSGTVLAQVRSKDALGNAQATDIAKIKVDDILHEGEI